MTVLNFIGKDGRDIAVEAPGSLSVMQAAVQADVAGIDADCGGCMACGTCHVIVTGGAALPPASDMERTILDNLAEPHPDARLSCQIRVADCTQAMRLRIPRSQR